MNISIFGLGYVGCVGAACLAKLGHKVIGVDVNENKVRLMNEGKPTIIEEGIAELCEEAHKKGLMSATTVAAEAIADRLTAKSYKITIHGNQSMRTKL